MKLRNIVISISLASSILFSGCYGSFKLVTSVHGWNGSVTDNKFVHELLFIGLNIIPVYGIAAFVDVLIINTIEFWSGTNPISMKEGDREIQYVKANGERYKITATKNQFHVLNEATNEAVALRYEPAETAWFVEGNGSSNKLTQFELKNNRKTIKKFFPDGTVKSVDI